MQARVQCKRSFDLKIINNNNVNNSLYIHESMFKKKYYERLNPVASGLMLKNCDAKRC